jgi:hypothetical protein
MPFTVDVHEQHGLAVAYCDGLVREEEVFYAIEFSFASNVVRGGIDRVVRIEPTADLRQLDAEALHRIQSHVFDVSNAQGGLAAFRSVLIASSPFHRPIAELYKAIWDSQQLPGVEFSVVTTMAEATTMLGLPSWSELLIRAPATPASERR